MCLWVSYPVRKLISMNKVELFQNAGIHPDVPVRRVLALWPVSGPHGLSDDRWAAVQRAASIYEPKNVNKALWRRWRPFIIACLAASEPTRLQCVRGRMLALWNQIGVVEPNRRTTVGELLGDPAVRAMLVRDAQTRSSRAGLAHVKRNMQAMQRGILGDPRARVRPSSDGPARGASVATIESLIATGPGRVRAQALQVRRWLQSTDPSAPAPTRDVACLRHWARRNRSAVVSLAELRGIRFTEMAMRDVPAVTLLSQPGFQHEHFDLQAAWMSDPVPTFPLISKPWTIPSLAAIDAADEGSKMSMSRSTRRPRPAPRPRVKSPSLLERQRGLLTPPKPLPADLELILADPAIKVISPEQWDQHRELIVEIMRRAHIRGVESFKKKLRVVAMFVTWAMESDYEPDLKELLTDFTINNWIRLGLPDVNDQTKATYRAHLRVIAANANPSHTAPPKPERVRHLEIRSPYTADEVATMIRTAHNQRHESLIGQLLACLALGVGAGLDAVDLKDLAIGHIHDHGPDGIEVSVPGQRPRTVWLLQPYEDLLRSGLALLSPHGPVVCPVTRRRRGPVSELYSQVRQVGNASVHFEQGRMRATWLCILMNMPVPLAVLLKAAGLESARSIADLLPHAQAMSKHDVHTILRGVAA